MQILRIVLLLIALAGSVWLGWEFFDAAVRPNVASTGAPAGQGAGAGLKDVGRGGVEARIATAPEYQAFFAAFKSSFPADYDRVVEGFAERAVQASRLESPDLYLAEAVRALRKSHGLLAARADGPALERVFTVQEQVVTAMAGVDPRLCVDFLYGAATQAFFDFSAANRALVAGMAQAGLDAMADGRARKIERKRPSDEDFAELEQALVDKGLGRAEIEALLDGKTPDPPAPDAAMCRAGRVYLESLKGLPEDARLRIYGLAVELLARS